MPPSSGRNGHLYYLLLPSPDRRDEVLQALARRKVGAVFHYVPLHSAPAGRRFGRTHGELAITENASACLLRLPLWVGMGDSEVEHVIDSVRRVVGE